MKIKKGRLRCDEVSFCSVKKTLYLYLRMGLGGESTDKQARRGGVWCITGWLVFTTDARSGPIAHCPPPRACVSRTNRSPKRFEEAWRAATMPAARAVQYARGPQHTPPPPNRPHQNKQFFFAPAQDAESSSSSALKEVSLCLWSAKKEKKFVR